MNIGAVTLHQGDCFEVLAVLADLADESVQAIVTSPPYYGLRDYGVDGQIGLEESLSEYLSKMVAVFRECRRVLRADGTAWVNMGDSYSSVGGPGHQGKTGQRANRRVTAPNYNRRAARFAETGMKSKDLMGVPWRLAFALQDDGWYLRQDIIWSKPNPMPESVTDRCTKAHEYIFLLSKSERYYYDQEAIKEPVSGTVPAYKTPDGWDTSKGDGGHGTIHKAGREKGKQNESYSAAIKSSGNLARKERGGDHDGHGGAVAGSVPWEGSKRNKRSVWSVPSKPYKEAHFATFPPALIEPCILAGAPAGGIVLDPFGGSGTTGEVAAKLGRKAILIELNPDYLALAERRVTDAQRQTALEFL